MLIRNANIADSGVYKCQPAGGSPTNIKVHVFLHGEIIIVTCAVWPKIFIQSKLYVFVLDFEFFA